MSNLDESLTPSPNRDVDFKSLPSQPTAEEFFVLSRIDGSQTVAQICTTSGLGKEKTLRCIEQLRHHGLILFPGETPKGPPRAAPKSAKPAASDDLASAIQTRFPVAFQDFPFDQELLAQAVEIEDDFKQEILFVAAQLDDVTYYELLGVSPDAGRRDLRASYFKMSKRYHPDRFFRKVLGDFEPLIERIFRRITGAYQTLSHRQKRAEYDASLANPVPTEDTSTQAEEENRKRELAFQLMSQRAQDALVEGNLVTAVRDFRKALSLKRDLGLAMMATRRLMAHAPHLDDAALFARAAQKIDPSSPEPRRLLGQIYERKGLPDDALLHYEKALSSSPDDQDLQDRIARLRQQAS